MKNKNGDPNERAAGASIKIQTMLLFRREPVQNAVQVNICAAVLEYRYGIACWRFQERNTAVRVCFGCAVERVRLARNKQVSAGLPDLRLRVLRREIRLSDKGVFGWQGFGWFRCGCGENDARKNDVQEGCKDGSFHCELFLM